MSSASGSSGGEGHLPAVSFFCSRSWPRGHTRVFLPSGPTPRHLDSILSGRIHGYSSSERLARRYYIEGIRNRLVRGRRAPDPPCVALTDHVRLMPNGDVTVCRSNLSVVGNAARSGFRPVWFGPEAARLRQVVRQCKRCWYTCEAIPNGIFSGDLLRWYVTSATR